MFLADVIKNTSGITVKVDSAFSNLLCHMNRIAAFFTECGAGRRFFAVDANGYIKPCSHIDIKEKKRKLTAYMVFLRLFYHYPQNRGMCR